MGGPSNKWLDQARPRCVGPSDTAFTCPQTYEFGNSGCAEIVGRLFSEGRLATAGPGVSTVLMARARAVEGANGGVEDSQILADSGLYRLRLTRYAVNGNGLPDTTTVWVVGLLVADQHVQAGSQPRVLLADSTRRVITLAPVGARFTVDTVDLHLH